jgi:hypothetical protein
MPDDSREDRLRALAAQKGLRLRRARRVQGVMYWLHSAENGQCYWGAYDGADLDSIEERLSHFRDRLE